MRKDRSLPNPRQPLALVLAIETNPEDARWLDAASVWAEFPFRVEVAQSIDDARRAISTRSYDVIVTGDELLDPGVLDASDFIDGRQVVLLSELAESRVVSRAHELGIDTLMFKDPAQRWRTLIGARIEGLIEAQRRENPAAFGPALVSPLASSSVAPPMRMAAHAARIAASAARFDDPRKAGRKPSREPQVDTLMARRRRGSSPDLGRPSGELREMQSFTQQVLDSLPHGVNVRDLDKRYRSWNPFMERLTGVTAEQAIGRTTAEVFPHVAPGSLEAISDAVNRALLGETVVMPDMRLELGGVTMWTAGIHGPLRDAEGQIVGTLTLIQDISARKQAEERLGKERDFSTGLVSMMRDGFSMVAPDGLQLDVNDAFCQMTGFSRKELVGAVPPNYPYWPPEELGAIASAFQRALGSEPEMFDLTFMRRNGERFPVTVYPSTIKDDHGNIVCYIATVRDVTERKRAEQALKLAHISLEAASDALYWANVEGDVVDVNTAACRAMGYTRDEMIALHVRDLDPHYSDALWNAYFAKLRAEGSFTVESVLQTKEGRIIPVEVTATYVVLGDIERSCAFVRDISERHRLAVEREQLAEQARQSQKMEAVGQLVGGVAHDFNNMVCVTLLAANEALRALEPQAPGRVLLEQILDIANRSADLTRQLLAFAQKQTIVPRWLDLNDTVDRMLAMLKRLLGEEITLRWEPASELCPVHMDPTQVDQILANLTVNSRDAIAGFGIITVKLTNVELDAADCAAHPGTAPGRYVALTVTDNGCGMDPATQSRIFEPFFTTKPVGRGTGLGLATVYGITRQNQGGVRVESAPGRGTTLTVFLPRSEPRSSTDPRDEVVEITGGTETILLVEDEPALLELTKNTLERFGYRVLATSSPAEALDIAKHWDGAVDLLMTDVVMPGLSGLDLRQRLRALFPKIQCLFVSGYIGSVLAQHGVETETLHYLAKPYSPDSLAMKVREVLGASSSSTPDGPAISTPD